jgi:hypothetical protein
MAASMSSTEVFVVCAAALLGWSTEVSSWLGMYYIPLLANMLSSKKMNRLHEKGNRSVIRKMSFASGAVAFDGGFAGAPMIRITRLKFRGFRDRFAKTDRSTNKARTPKIARFQAFQQRNVAAMFSSGNKS